MAGAPCGCQLATEAEDMADPDDRAHGLALAEETRRQWRCPYAGHPEPAPGDDGAALPQPCRDARERVAKRTGVPVPATCPLYPTTMPWAHAAVDLWELRESRSPDCFYRGRVTPALIDAATEVGRGFNARRADDVKRDTPKSNDGHGR